MDLSKRQQAIEDLQAHAVETTTKLETMTKAYNDLNISYKLLSDEHDKMAKDVRLLKQLQDYTGLKEEFDGIVEKTGYNADDISDFRLYIDGERDDIEAYLAMYGLMPDRVLELYRDGIEYAIKVIEYQNNLQWGKKDEIPDVVMEKFFYFLRQVWRTDNLPSTEDPGTPVSKAYHAYYKTVAETML